MRNICFGLIEEEVHECAGNCFPDEDDEGGLQAADKDVGRNYPNLVLGWLNNICPKNRRPTWKLSTGAEQLGVQGCEKLLALETLREEYIVSN